MFKIKNKTIVTIIVVVLSFSFNLIFSQGQVIGQMIRKDFIKDVLGIEEETFRQNSGWNKNNNLAMAGYDTKTKEFIKFKNENNKWIESKRISQVDWIKQYPRRAAIFQGDFTVKTIAQMDKLIGNNPKKLTNKAEFKIVIHDPKNPTETDIMTMQADPKNHANTSFQLASTFWGPLEGGMSNPNALLVNMLKHPVQGEDATTGAPGAAIWRKYFMPTYRVAKGKKPYYFLLEKLAPKITEFKPGSIDSNKIKAYEVDINDIKKVLIATHKDIVVSAGSVTNKSNNAFSDIQDTLSVISNNGKIDPNNTQLTTQIFIAAYSMKYALDKDQFMNKNIQNFAKMILNAAYEGTVKAAYISQNPKLVLTLMGAGAFRNNILWLAEAFERNEFKDFIKKTGLQVEITYRPDKYRPIDVQKGWPTRNAQEDSKFLKRLINVADYINDTDIMNTKNLDKTLNEYLTSAYNFSQNPADQNAKNRSSQKAKKLNMIFSNKIKKEKKVVVTEELQRTLNALNSNLIGLKEKK